MSKELLQVVDAVANEKGVPKGLMMSSWNRLIGRSV